MTTYRVGASGATVFDEDGRAMLTLRPGVVVVEGLLASPGSLAEKHQRSAERKRLRPAEDKRLRPTEDK